VAQLNVMRRLEAIRAAARIFVDPKTQVQKRHLGHLPRYFDL
jgi:hypothetical protein